MPSDGETNLHHMAVENGLERLEFGRTNGTAVDMRPMNLFCNGFQPVRYPSKNRKITAEIDADRVRLHDAVLLNTYFIVLVRLPWKRCTSLDPNGRASDVDVPPQRH